ncbi:hypothetical protein ON010_g4277 [Phytophthora cinnamomi]|nr:hypothetical protein ON010_g4277 [Phytophthora cinnamomi]
MLQFFELPVVDIDPIKSETIALKRAGAEFCPVAWVELDNSKPKLSTKSNKRSFYRVNWHHLNGHVE